MDKIKVEPIWSDSMGAKSLCVKVSTDDTNIMIDPSAAVMQKSYPIETDRKYQLLSDAKEKITREAEDVDHMIVTHYHYDHHFLPKDENLNFSKIFEDKKIWIKNPNEWINHSQWKRSRKFLRSLINYKQKKQEVTSLAEYEFKSEDKEYRDPLDDLPLLQEIEEGDYAERREELHKKWRKNFKKRTDMWNDKKHVKEPCEHDIYFADGICFTDGDTTVRFTEPLFHGIEYAKTGWIIAVVVEKEDEKFLYTSDIQGPTIEDYAQWIIEENPNFLIMDGPATYLLGFMLNNFNLDRSIKNAVRIVEETDCEKILYDHHLTREKNFREKTEEIWDAGERSEGEILTFREYLEDKPVLVEEL
ncbi:MAG: MBL fold metallo-hydrolase [Thermoplasmatota archaeon]